MPCRLNIFLYIFWWARVCRKLICLCRPFGVFERCLDSNSENCRSKQARYQLSRPSSYLATYLPADECCTVGECCRSGRIRSAPYPFVGSGSDLFNIKIRKTSAMRFIPTFQDPRSATHISESSVTIFWVKNTIISLSIGSNFVLYLFKNKIILNFVKFVTTKSKKSKTTY